MRNIQEIFRIEITNEDLFKQALTHPSYTNEMGLPYSDNYERLEFLGDAVLKLMLSNILFKKYPDLPEGEMSKIRSIAVSDNTLAKISSKLGLNKLIIASNHDLKQGINRLESVIACSFEAILGAYYLDGKYKELLSVASDLFNPYIEEISQNFGKYNAKAILQEYTQSINKKTPVYTLISSTGPQHDMTFEIEVSYNNKVIATGKGKSKKEAEQRAAYEACKKLGAL